MLNYKQLYQANKFDLPEIIRPQLKPFPDHQILPHPDPNRDASIAKLFKDPQYHFMSFKSSYSSQFERLCAKENLYPFMMGVGTSKIVIVCKDMLMLSSWKINDLGRVFEGGDDLITFQKWEKTKLPEIPTTIKVGQFGVYLGFQTGKISQFLFKTKAWEGSNEQLQFPVLKIQILHEQQGKEASVIGLDSAGNIVQITFSHKTFMDKIIKTLSTVKWVSFVFRNKKRQRIKKLFKNLMKNETDTQTGSTETVESSTPYNYNKMDLKQIKNDIVLAVFRKNILELLVLNKEFQLVKTVIVDDSHKGQKEIEAAFVEIGVGGFQNANTTHNILVLGLGYSIHYYRIIQIEQSYEVVKVSQVQVESPLIYGSFISNNLLAVGDRHQLYLTSINSKPQSLVALETLKFSYVDFFIDEQNLDIDKQLLFSNLFCLLHTKTQQDKLFMGLQGKRLIIGKIFGWRTILNKILFQRRFQFAIRCFQSIYNLQFKLCCGVSENTATRNDQMRQLCQKIIKGYIQINLLALKANPYSEDSACIVNNFIYFLLKCQQPQVLFQTAERLFAENQLQELFLEEMDRYVQKTNGYELKITFITEKYLKLIITRYKIKGKQYALQQFFMGFDLNQMQRLVLLTTCLQEGLYRSLINICCEQKDYITPIIKLCGIGINNPTQQRRIGEIIFWYLGECLAGRMTEFGNDQQYLNMLTVLINFMFIPSSIEMLLSVSHKYMITTIQVFFQPRIMRFIMENQDRFFMRKDCQEGLLFEQNCLSQFRLYQKMLLSLMGVIQKSNQQARKDYQQELNRFLIPLMLKNHLPFLAKFKINIIRYFIAHPLLYIGGQEFTEEQQLQVNGQLMRLLDSLIRSISQKCLNLRQKIKQDPQTINELQNLLKREKQNELNSILELMMLSPFSQQFSQTKCYIYHQIGQYAIVLQSYLKMLNKKIRTKVFNYLQNNINQFSQLTFEFIKYLISFLRIDQKKTIKLLQQIRSNWVDHEQIIDKLVDYPAIQLNYIEKVLNSGVQKSKKLLLRHLQIVLRQKSENVQAFISKIDYPLEEAFKMCEEHNNRMGKACILIKSGRNMEGVIIISQIFLESVRQYFIVLKKGLQIEWQRKNKIMSQFRVVLQTCQKEWQIDNQRGQDIWQKNTQLIFRKMGVYNIDSPHIPESIRQFLSQIISELLATMFQQVSTQFFFNRFVKTFSSLPLRIFFLAYKYIQNRLEFSFTIEKLNTDLLQQEELRTWKEIMSSIYHAHICELTCVSCSHIITNNQKMVSYSCQHVYHEECYYQQNSKKSKNQLCPLCFSVIENYLICVQSKPHRYRLQVDQKQLLRVKIGKMNYYDRITQLNGMQSWNKFFDQVDF